MPTKKKSSIKKTVNDEPIVATTEKSPVTWVMDILADHSPEDQNAIIDMVVKNLAADRISNASRAEANHNRCSECLDDFTRKFGKVTYKPSL